MIRLKESAVWNRRFEVTGIPTEHKDDPAEMDILITYPMDNVHGPKVILAAVALDRHVIPAIARAVNSHEALLEALKALVAIEDSRFDLPNHGLADGVDRMVAG